MGLLSKSLVWISYPYGWNLIGTHRGTVAEAVAYAASIGGTVQEKGDRWF